MNAVSDHVIINRLRDEDNTSFALLYQFYFPAIASYITHNCGNEADAEDVFQEAIIVFLHKVKQPDFVLTSSLKTYLFSIAKNNWFKRLRDNKLLLVDEIETYHQATNTNDVQPQPNLEQKLMLWLKMITENCQRILKAIFFYREPMESLIQKMGWKNKHTAANQQYKCLQQVRKEKDKHKEIN